METDYATGSDLHAVLRDAMVYWQKEIVLPL